MYKRYQDLTIDEKINVKSWVNYSFENYDREHKHLLFFARLAVAVNKFFQEHIGYPCIKH